MEEEEEKIDCLLKTISGSILKTLIENEQEWENSANEYCFCLIKTCLLLSFLIYMTFRKSMVVSLLSSVQMVFFDLMQ